MSVDKLLPRVLYSTPNLLFIWHRSKGPGTPPFKTDKFHGKFNFGKRRHANLRCWPIASCLDNTWVQNGGSFLIVISCVAPVLFPQKRNEVDGKGHSAEKTGRSSESYCDWLAMVRSCLARAQTDDEQTCTCDIWVELKSKGVGCGGGGQSKSQWKCGGLESFFFGRYVG